MFIYIIYLFLDELRPLSCDGIDTWGKYSLTLIDSLDTLAVMENYTEFNRVVSLLKEKQNFDADINVSVFETNIRIVGGLLGAHLLSHKAGVPLDPGWPCNGPLLRLAEDVAKRLLPAFDTKTGMPYGTVNLRHGVPPKETSVTSVAGIGTFIIEFGTLSRLSGDPVYEEAALAALHALFEHRSPIGLVGNHVDVQTGKWTAQDSGIGSSVDSYFEYLVKGAILLNRPELMVMFHENRRAIDKYLKRDDWYIWASMNKGQVTLPVFQSLEAFWPGVLSMIGDINSAVKTFHNYHTVWRQYGFMPEIYNIPNGEAALNKESYPLRPEHIESAMYLYRSTGDPFYLEVGEDILRSIQHSAKTGCGYATIKNVKDHRKEDRMESFFLAETLKYLYLLFDPENFIHNDGRTGTLLNTPSGGECIIESGGYIFNTEAHVIDPGALRCCSEVPRENIFNNYDPDIVIGDILTEKPKQEKVKQTITKVTKEPLIEHLEITIAELQEFLAKAKHLEEQTKNTSNEPSSTDDNLIQAIEKLNRISNKPATNENNATKDSDNTTDSDSEHKAEAVTTGEGKVIPIESNSDVEILKLTTTPDSDLTINESTAPFNSVDAEELTESLKNYTIIYKEKNMSDEKAKQMIIDNLINGTGVNDTITNTSVFQDFVQTIIKATTHTVKSEFDPQQFLENIRANNIHRNESWSSEYHLLTCRQQPFLQRLAVLGQFFY